MQDAFCMPVFLYSCCPVFWIMDYRLSTIDYRLETILLLLYRCLRCCWLGRDEPMTKHTRWPLHAFSARFQVIGGPTNPNRRGSCSAHFTRFRRLCPELGCSRKLTHTFRRDHCRSRMLKCCWYHILPVARGVQSCIVFVAVCVSVGRRCDGSVSYTIYHISLQFDSNRAWWNLPPRL